MQAAGEVALEASHGLALGLALGDAPCDVGLGVGVVRHAPEGDGVDCPVEPAVAASVEAVAGGVPRGRGDRAGPGECGERRLGSDPAVVGPGHDEDGRGDGPDPAPVEEVWRNLADEAVELARVGRCMGPELSPRFRTPQQL